ncbi:MAG: Gfo/Idh/MocA family protein, partial [Phycisphaerae bacterium]
MQAPQESNRRDILKAGALAVASALVGAAGCASRNDPNNAPHRDSRTASGMKPVVTKPMERVRIGFVGVGGMGTNHVNQLLRVPGAEIVAVCDIVPEHAARAADLVEKAGFGKPAQFTKGPTDYKRLCETVDCDIVYTATPWELHV